MSRQTDDNAEPWVQDNFENGLVKNAPHDDIPSTAVAGLVNAHSHSTEIQPRLASWLWSELQPLPWRDDCGIVRSGYTLIKDKNIVTSSEAIFSRALVSCWIAWPVDDGYYHDEIIDYISEYKVKVSLSGDIDQTDNCYVHGRLNLNDWHNTSRKKVWQIGNRVYTSPVSYSHFDECICVSRRTPSNVISAWDEMDEYGIIGNSNGIFKLSFNGGVGKLWRINGPVPDALLEGNIRRKNHKKRYDYLISMSRINGAGIRDRMSERIVQQSGTTRLNTSVIPNRDYSTYWTEKAIGNGSETGCRLICGRMSDIHKDPGYYRTIAAPGASFTFTHNEYKAEFLVDMSTTGANVQSMQDVLNSIVMAINTAFPRIKGKYNDAGYFEFNTGEEKNATIGYFGPGTSGTDISEVIKGVEGESHIDNEWSYTAPNQIGICYIPKDQNRYEWHWSHYTVWRSTDISEDGADPRTTGTGEELPPLKFTWCGDYRVASAFYASMDNGIVTALIGSFQKADEGTPLEFENGNRYTITEYISIRKVRIGGDYYGSSEPLQACGIGNGRIMRASQNGNIVTLETELNEDSFSATECDVRKTLYWSDGYESIIVEDYHNGTVKVHDNAVRSTQGVTLDPVCRVITDTTTDETLRNRMNEKSIGLLNMRFKEPLLNCNVLSVIPGFMLTARRGESLIPYCDLAVNLKYNAGYHLLGRQVIDNIEAFIQFIKKSENYFIVWCSNSLWGGPTNNPDIRDLPEFGEWYGVLHADIINKDIGAVDWGSIEEVSNGVFELICQDMSVRQLINRKYSDDLTHNSNAQDIIATDLKKCWNLSASAYGRTLGQVWWMTLK
jgi:hypothetical protein